MSYSVKHLPKAERPREKLIQKGEASLSTAELIAILLGSGTKQRSVLELAQDIIAHFGQNLPDASVEELAKVKGVGPAKAVLLKAALALSARFQRSSDKTRIQTPEAAYQLFRPLLENEPQEKLVALLLDTKSCHIATETIAVGSLNSAAVRPRELFRPAIRRNAASLIIAHNHPSGDPTPSLQDKKLTRILADAGKLLQIPIQDHLIIGNHSYFSLRELIQS